ncbi:MAG TPA: 2-dehydro-3-deoxygalactonokinase [Armatimonadota bacterium]|jgi:2-dehydro-3-deoxygalactonokinase
MTSTSYIWSCDWGTSAFRLRLVEADSGHIMADRCSDDGVATLAVVTDSTARAQAFRETLRRHIMAIQADAGSVAARAVMVSGMASANIGWCALAYATLPVSIDGAGFRYEALEPLTLSAQDAPLPVWLVSGLASADDVMRGEETEIVGVLSHPDFAAFRQRAVLVLPGTHAKHIQVVAGQITAFATYMTGELFAMLATQSILRFSVSERAEQVVEDDFIAGVQDAQGLALAQALFRVRTRQLLHDVSPARNRSYLSGLLVGAEVGGLLRECSDDTPVLLCAGPHHAQSYQLACTALAAAHRVVPVPPAVMQYAATRGHQVLYSYLYAL